MPRTLNPVAHALKRDAFLDAAERLIRTGCYEQMTISGFLDDLGASKGAFYHYFDSKEALLEAVIDRMTDAGMAVVRPIVEDPNLQAAAKLQAVFSTVGRWKTERSDLLLALIRAWYSSGNDLVRIRVGRAATAGITALIGEIVRQGTAEGDFDPASPDDTASILMSLLLGSGDTVGQMVLDYQDGLVTLAQVQRYVKACEEAIERILGLPAGSFVYIDPPTLRVWFD